VLLRSERQDQIIPEVFELQLLVKRPNIVSVSLEPAADRERRDMRVE
jgi:hypothetical protein